MEQFLYDLIINPLERARIRRGAGVWVGIEANRLQAEANKIARRQTDALERMTSRLAPSNEEDFNASGG